MKNQASPLLRSDFAQSTAGHTPNGDLTDSFVPSDGRAVPLESSWPPRWRSPLGKVAHMEAEFTIEPTGRRVALAKLRSVLRGDKCMADASLLDAPGRAVPGASTTGAGLSHA